MEGSDGIDGVETVPVDYNKPETLKEALMDVNKIFLLSRDSPTMVELTSTVITQARNAGIKHIVRLSAKDADLKAESPSLRMRHEFMQNFINLHGSSIKNNNAFYMAVGDSKVSIVDVRDIAAVAIKALAENVNDSKHSGKTYTITGPETLSYYQIAEILSSVLGKKISSVNLSEEDFKRVERSRCR